MPSIYAHYRFGVALLATVPGDVRRTIQRFRGLYDMGLHGPDIFYYHSPIVKAKAGFLGIKYHEQTGQAFFQRVCRAVRLERSEAAMAYLYGVLSHYCLDSMCHPFVNAHAAEASHGEIETEFDRFLLERDNKIPPCSQDLSLHLHLTPGECETVAKFYPPASASDVQGSVRGMARFTKLMAAPEGPRRVVMEKGIQLVAPEFLPMVMTIGPNSRCAHLDGELLALYEQAIAIFPEMLTQLQAHMTYNAPFGSEFEPIFG